MKKSLFKAIIYNFISAVLIVNFDLAFQSRQLLFNEKVPVIILTLILIFIDIIVALFLIFFLLKLFKVRNITLFDITKNLIHKFSFVSLISTSLNLLLCGFLNNIIFVNQIPAAINIILYALVLLNFIKEFNLTKFKKYIIALLFVIPFLLRR